MEVREQDLVLADQREFFRLRFFDLDDQIRSGPNLRALGDDGGACSFVVFIRDPTAEACATLDQYLVARSSQFVRSYGQERDAVLVRFDLFRYADNHLWSLVAEAVNREGAGKNSRKCEGGRQG